MTESITTSHVTHHDSWETASSNAAPTSEDLYERAQAMLAAPLAAEEAAGVAAGAQQLLDVSESVATERRFHDKDIRKHLKDAPSPLQDASIPLLVLPLAVLHRDDRPTLRRDSYRGALSVKASEETALTAMAAAILCSDLFRFDLETSLIRLRQTFLEDAPAALHRRFVPLDLSAPLGSDADPGAALHIAITALSRSDTISGVLEELVMYGDESGGASVVLAAALAGARDGLKNSQQWMTSGPQVERCITLAHNLVDARA